MTCFAGDADRRTAIRLVDGQSGVVAKDAEGIYGVLIAVAVNVRRRQAVSVGWQLDLGPQDLQSVD